MLEVYSEYIECEDID